MAWSRALPKPHTSHHRAITSLWRVVHGIVMLHFLDTSNDTAWFPQATWHAARLAFARTSAVWSMVGHIVGLGDRHGENILLDAAAGDAVHVDFACLFDKARRPQTPKPCMGAGDTVHVKFAYASLTRRAALLGTAPCSGQHSLRPYDIKPSLDRFDKVRYPGERGY